MHPQDTTTAKGADGRVQERGCGHKPFCLLPAARRFQTAEVVPLAVHNGSNVRWRRIGHMGIWFRSRWSGPRGRGRLFAEVMPLAIRDGVAARRRGAAP
jgi:hypothetical protein